MPHRPLYVLANFLSDRIRARQRLDGLINLADDAEGGMWQMTRTDDAGGRDGGFRTRVWRRGADALIFWRIDHIDEGNTGGRGAERTSSTSMYALHLSDEVPDLRTAVWVLETKCVVHAIWLRPHNECIWLQSS